MRNHHSLPTLPIAWAVVLVIGLTTGLTNAKLVALYEFDKDASDSTGNGLNGTLVGNASIVLDAERGKVLSLDGDGDYVDCGNNPAFNITDKITVAAWIKVRAFDRDWQAIVTKGDSAWRIARYSYNDSIKFNCDGTTINGVIGSKNVNDGKWHHVAGVYDGRKLALYVDGRLDNYEDTSGSIEINTFNVWIGANAEQEYEGYRTWNGLIDDVAIFNHALDPNEITKLYSRGAASFNLP